MIDFTCEACGAEYSDDTDLDIDADTCNECG